MRGRLDSCDSRLFTAQGSACQTPVRLARALECYMAAFPSPWSWVNLDAWQIRDLNLHFPDDFFNCQASCCLHAVIELHVPVRLNSCMISPNQHGSLSPA
jgi:hypothetical protein